MRVLITGCSGFVGRHLTQYLQQATDWTIHGISRHPDSVPGLSTQSLDLRDAAAVRRVIAEFRPDVICHLAGQASVAESFKDPRETLEINLLSQLSLLEAVRAIELDTLVLLISSNEVYGMINPADLPLTEAAPFRPANPYAVSKVAQEMLGLQYHLSYGLRVIRMRPFNHIGPGQDERFVVPGFARQIAHIEAGLQEPVLRVGNLEVQRDFTDVRDIVRGYTLALQHGRSGDVYNLGTGRCLAIRQLLDLLLEQSTVRITVQLDPTRMRPADVPVMVCDATHFCQQTGWQPQIPIEQTLADVLAEARHRVQ